MANQSNKDRRQSLYDRYSNNLNMVKKCLGVIVASGEGDTKIEISGNVYICPLCLNGFEESTLDQKHQNPLTLEHIPPSSLAGRPMILTCKNCNNKSGEKLDHLILTSFTAEAFLAGKKNMPINAKISINDQNRFSVSAEISGDKEFEFLAQGKNPRYARSQMDSLKTDWQNSRMKLSFQVPAKGQVAIGLLRIGYLRAYSFFGHALLIDANSSRLRNQIQNPNESNLPHAGVFNLNPGINTKDGVYLIKKPIRSYLVVFTIGRNQYKEQIGVLIPGPGVEGWNDYLTMTNILPNSELIINYITDFNCIDEFGFVDGYFQFWFLAFHGKP
ncbi:MAG: hypothetical protein WC865_12065 [Bacteroidales bacterium]